MDQTGISKTGSGSWKGMVAVLVTAFMLMMVALPMVSAEAPAEEPAPFEEAAPHHEEQQTYSASFIDRFDSLMASSPIDPVPTLWDPVTPLPGGRIRYARAHVPSNTNSFYIFTGLDGAFTASTGSHRYDADTDTWNSLAPVPNPTEGPTGACDGTRVFVMGGDGTTHNQIYDIETDTWFAGAALPRNCWGAAAGVWGGNVYLVGGDSDFWFGGTSNQVNIYNIASDSWVGTGTNMPVAALAAGYYQIGSYLYVVGGWNDASPAANVQATQRYDMATDTWSTGPIFTPQKADFALAASGNVLYAIGGDATGGTAFNPTSDIWSLYTDTWPAGAWEDCADPLGFSTMANAAGAYTDTVTGSEVWSVGGFDGGTIFGHTVYKSVPEYWFAPGPDIQTNFGSIGEWVEHRVWIHNKGTKPDVYLPMFSWNTGDSTVDADWWTKFHTVDLRPQGIYNGIDDGSEKWWWGPVQPGKIKEYAIKVFVPTDMAGAFDQAWITITSSNDPSVVGGVEIWTRTSIPVPFHDDFERAGDTDIFGMYNDGGFLGDVHGVWKRTDDTRAGVSDATHYSPTHSMFTRNGEVTVTSAKINLDVPYAIASAVIQRGDDGFSGAPGLGHDLIVEYSDGNFQWTQWHELDTFYGGGMPGEVFTPYWVLPQNALNSRFQLRFRQTGGSGVDFDYWHIDNVYIGAPESDFEVQMIMMTMPDTDITIWFDDFEDGDFSDWTRMGTHNDWQIGTPAGLGGDPPGAYQGMYSIGNDLTGLGNPGRYENNVPANQNYIYSPAIDCIGYNDVTLEFYRWLGIENSRWDHAYIYVSNDGMTWHEVWRHTAGTFTDSEWTLVSYDISAWADNQETVYIRFDMGPTDGSVVFCGWNIDDIRLYGTQLKLIPPRNYGGPGEIIAYDVSVQNFAIHSDGYSITIDGNQWPTTLALNQIGPVGPSGPLNTGTFQVFVEVPADAEVGMVDTATLTVTSLLEPWISETLTITSMVARVHNLDQNKWYMDIQPAVDEAAPGDHIFAHSGVYYENVLVEKSLILEGEDKETTIVDGMFSGSPFTVRSTGVMITGFTIRNSGFGTDIFVPERAGVFLDGADGCEIIGNRMIDNHFGIISMFGTLNLIQSNEFHGNVIGHYSMNQIEDDFSADSNLWIYENDATLETGPGYMQLTPSLNDQIGRALFIDEVGITSRFVVEFDYRIGEPGGGGADGMVFMFYKNTDYVPNDGGSLAFGNTPGYGIEFEHWTHNRRIGLIQGTSKNYVDNTFADGQFNYNQWHTARIEVDASSITVYNDDIHVFTWEGTIDRTFSGMGFCAATGGSRASHRVRDFRITPIGGDAAWDVFGGNVVSGGIIGSATIFGQRNLIIANLYSGNMVECVLGLEVIMGYTYPSRDNVVILNDFIHSDDTFELALDFTPFIAPGLNQWDGSATPYGNFGNYWSDYDTLGASESAPGVWDTPYEIQPAPTQDNYPLMNRFTSLSISASSATPMVFEGETVTQFITTVEAMRSSDDVTVIQGTEPADPPAGGSGGGAPPIQAIVPPIEEPAEEPEPAPEPVSEEPLTEASAQSEPAPEEQPVSTETVQDVQAAPTFTGYLPAMALLATIVLLACAVWHFRKKR